MLQVLYVRMAKSMLSLVSFHDLVVAFSGPGHRKAATRSRKNARQLHSKSTRYDKASPESDMKTGEMEKPHR